MCVLNFLNSFKNQTDVRFALQLNSSVVGDVHIKVSIARKQPMLDAATGKSVWASLGERGAPLWSLSAYLACANPQRLSPSCPEQHQRLVQGQEEPGGVQRRLPVTARTALQHFYRLIF